MHSSGRLSRRGRVAAAACGLALAAPAVVTATLTPDPRGWGTHEQLGAAPCRWRQWTGRACPSCGMTTAWALAVRGEWAAAARANLGGATALVGAAAGAAALLASAATGRRGIASWRLRTWGYLAAGWLAVVLIDWARRLVDA